MEHPSCIQFRGLSSHYKPRDPIKVVIRYAVGGDFSASAGDTLGVFPEDASTVGEALSTVNIEEPPSHRPCDGGLYNASSVTINLPEQLDGDDHTSKKYRIWYICIGTGEAVCKSDTFTVCASGMDFPGVPPGSMDDQTMMRAVHSLDDSISGSYVDAGDPLNTNSALGSSFVLVSEGSSCEVLGSEYLVSREEQKSLQGCEVVCSADVTSDISASDGGDSREEGCNHLRSKQEESLEEVGASSSLIGDYLVCPPFTNTLSPSKDEKSADSALSPDPLKTDIAPSDEPSMSDESSRSIKQYLELSSPVSYYSTGLSLALDPPEMVDMSCSTVIIEKFITQREARMLKSTNKESRAKIHKLSEILEEKKIEIANLSKALAEKESALSTVGESERRFEAAEKGLVDTISSLQEKVVEHRAQEREQRKQIQVIQEQLERSETTGKKRESLNKKLMFEKNTLEAKVKQLSQENKVMFDRSSKLFTQLQDSETKRGIEKSEKQVLQVKIDYLGAELRKIKARPLNGDASGGGVAPHPAGGHDWSDAKSSKSKPPRGGPEMPLASMYSRRPNELHLGHPHDRESANQQRALPQGNSSSRPKPSVAHDQQIFTNPELEPVERYRHGRLLTTQGNVSIVGGAGGSADYYETLQVGEDPHTGTRYEGADRGVGNAALNTLADADKTGRGLGGVVAAVMIECPICGKELRPSQSKENDFSVMMHVEHCIQMSEMSSPRDV